MKKEIRKLLRTFQKNWRLALVLIILTTITGYILSAYTLKKHYITTAQIYIESLDEESSTQKAATCVLLFSSPQMYNNINETLVSGFSYTEYENMLKVTQKNGTQLIDVSADCDNSDASYKLLVKYIDMMPKILDEYGVKAEITIVRDPAEPKSPSFPNDSLFTICGAAVGIVISLAAILLIWRLDQSITQDDDLTEEYGIAVLGQIPDFDNEVDYLGR